jgi:ribosomal protein S18 acetylase RimI-like enzyme
LRVGALRAGHRPRLARILRDTRVFRPDEIDVALELFDETFGDAPASAGARSAPTSRAADGETPWSSAASPDDDYLFLGAFTPQDELVGYACYGATPATDRTFDLYWIAVDPAAQGAGGGSQLLAEVERQVTGMNARMLVVETSSRSEYAPTRGFYERRGFTEAARIRNFYAPADDRIIFTKRVHAAPDGAEHPHHE